MRKEINYVPCYHPIQGYRSRSGRDSRTGRWPVVFNPSQGYVDMPVNVPCGKCIGCRLERSRQWAVRCVHEAQLHDRNCFLTLTYDDAHLPADGSLNLRDVQLFLKRLRKKVGSVRFFQCGEYGEQLSRPHHHMVLFGYDFEDKVLWSVRDGVKLYRSATLEELWQHGYSTIGDVTFESAAYVARYVTKKITGEMADYHYKGRKPEYVTMSRRPGIAHDWIKKYHGEVYDQDKVVVRHGLITKPPRYYDRIYDEIAPVHMADLRVDRKLSAKDNPNNTPERLEVREKIQKLKFEKLKRGYENV